MSEMRKLPLAGMILLAVKVVTRVVDAVPVFQV
jgi:hypothetical protein